MNNFAFVFLIGGALFLALAILFSFTNYKERFKHNYDVRNHFPYELNYESKFKENLMGNISFSLVAICSVCLFVFFDSNHVYGFFMFTMVAGIINSLIILSLIFVPLKYTKTHLGLVTGNIIFSFLIPFALAMQSALSYNKTKEGSSLVFIILNALICLVVFILVVNPKLTKWAVLDKKENEDGTLTYVRPKIFILAFTEWILLALNIIIQLMAILTNLIIK